MRIRSMLILLPLIFNISIDAAQVKGRATVELPKKGCSSDRPKNRDLHLKAIQAAKYSAWDNYLSSFSSEKIDAYRANEQIFKSNFSEYADDNYKIVFTECSQKSRTYTVVLNLTVNEQKVDSKLRELAGGSDIRSDLKGKRILTMVIPRQTGDADIFADKVNTQTETRKSSQVDAVLMDDGSSISSTESSKDRVAVTTGGKTTRKATERTYKIGDIQSATSQISDVLRPFGMKALAPSWLEAQVTKNGYDPFLKRVFDEFAGVAGDYGPNINPLTQEQVVQHIVDFGQGRVPYFLLGTVDTSIPMKDFDTGNYSADVLINIQLYLIDDFFGAELVASVGPEIKTAFGSSDVIASNAALKKAFDEAINSLIYKL